MIIWIFTKSQTGKQRFHTHYSFINIKFQSYTEDNNDIIIEEDTVKAISFNGGISVTTSILVDVGNIFGKRSLKKINFKIRTGARETHEVYWWKDSAGVTK